MASVFCHGGGVSTSPADCAVRGRGRKGTVHPEMKTQSSSPPPDDIKSVNSSGASQ